MKKIIMSLLFVSVLSTTIFGWGGWTMTGQFVPTTVTIQKALAYTAGTKGSLVYAQNPAGKPICSVLGAKIGGAEAVFVFVLNTSEDWEMYYTLRDAKKNAKPITIAYVSLVGMVSSTSNINETGLLEWKYPSGQIATFPNALGVGQ